MSTSTRTTSPAFPESRAHELRALPCSGTFEAHLTVDAPNEMRREAFASLCNAIGVKCVLIELAAGRTPSQPMTASYHRGDSLATVLTEIEALHAKLASAGFAVVRVKIEAVVTNVGVPETDEELARFPGAYFEFHAKLRLGEDVDLDRLRELCVEHHAHLSRNDRKQGEGDPIDRQRERFVTLRVYDAGRTRATTTFEALLERLKTTGHTIASVSRELTIYDSRETLDAGWLAPDSKREGGGASVSVKGDD